MLCVFIGGSLDGELREIHSDYAAAGQYVHVTGWHEESQEHIYIIANGIARHESVGEEEVAQMVHHLMEVVYGPQPENRTIVE